MKDEIGRKPRQTGANDSPDESTHTVYVDTRELSRRLSLSQRTIRTYLHQPDNPLPAYQIGNKLLFFWPEVQAWVRKYRVKTINTDVMVEDLINDISKESI